MSEANIERVKMFASRWQASSTTYLEERLKGVHHAIADSGDRTANRVGALLVRTGPVPDVVDIPVPSTRAIEPRGRTFFWYGRGRSRTWSWSTFRCRRRWSASCKTTLTYARDLILEASEKYKKGDMHNVQPDWLNDVTDGSVARQHPELLRIRACSADAQHKNNVLIIAAGTCHFRVFGGRK